MKKEVRDETKARPRPVFPIGKGVDISADRAASMGDGEPAGAGQRVDKGTNKGSDAYGEQGRGEGRLGRWGGRRQEEGRKKILAASRIP